MNCAICHEDEPTIPFVLSNIFCGNSICQAQAPSTCLVQQYSLKAHERMKQAEEAVAPDWDVYCTCIFCNGVLPKVILFRYVALTADVKEEDASDPLPTSRESDAAVADAAEPQLPNSVDPLPPTRIFGTMEEAHTALEAAKNGENKRNFNRADFKAFVCSLCKSPTFGIPPLCTTRAQPPWIP